MSDVGLPGVPNNDVRKELYDKIATFSDEVAEDPQAVERWEINDSNLAFGGEYGDIELTKGELPAIASFFIDSPDVSDFSSSQNLIEYVEDEFDQEISEIVLLKILEDALGSNLEKESPNITKARNNLLNYLEGYPDSSIYIPLVGLEIAKGGLVIDDLYLAAEMKILTDIRTFKHVNHLRGRYPAHSFLRIQNTHTQKSQVIPKHNPEKQVLLSVFSLYTGQYIESSGVVIRPYDQMPNGGLVEPERPISEKYKVCAHDGRRLGNMLDLLIREKYTRFNPLVETAISHFDHSITNWQKEKQSITFAYIGLESLYKQYTTGSTSGSDVRKFAGLLLGMAVPPLDAIEVRDNISKIYDQRNTLVHGEEYGTSADWKPSELQRLAWKYLRISIILFAWMEEKSALMAGGKLELDDVIIDMNKRKRLMNILSKFRVYDYLPI